MPSPCLSRSVTARRLAIAARKSAVASPSEPSAPSVPPSLVSWPSRPWPWATRSETSRKLWATARRSSAIVLYCGSWSSADSRLSRDSSFSAVRAIVSIAASSARTDLPLSGESSTPTAWSPCSARARSDWVRVRIALSRVKASGSS